MCSSTPTSPRATVSEQRRSACFNRICTVSACPTTGADFFLVINTALEHRLFPMKLRSWPSSKLRKKTMSIGLIFSAAVFPTDNMVGALSLCLYCGAEAISELISEMDLRKIWNPIKTHISPFCVKTTLGTSQEGKRRKHNRHDEKEMYCNVQQQEQQSACRSQCP